MDTKAVFKAGHIASVTCLAIAITGAQSQSAERIAPLPYNNYLTFEAGEVCDFPVEFSAGGEVQEVVTKDGHFLALPVGSHSALTNLRDPAKSITMADVGQLLVGNETLGNTLIKSRGQTLYIVEASDAAPRDAGLWLLIGDWTLAIDDLGDAAVPLSGKGRKIDLCRQLR